MATTNLGITEVTEAQSNKHVTVNEALEALDLAGNAVNTVTVDATADTAGILLTQAQLAAGAVQKLSASGADGDFNLRLPAVSRLFIVDNQSGYTATVMVDPDEDGADGATADVLTGTRSILVADGTNVYALTSTPIKSLTVAVSDETTPLATGTAKVTFRAPEAMNITDVRASLTTVSSSGDVTVDINEAGTSILSTKLTIDASEKTSTTAATPPVISDAAIADDAEITIDIDGAGTNATGLKVTLYYT
jgi:hypothetical protein